MTRRTFGIRLSGTMASLGGRVAAAGMSKTAVRVRVLRVMDLSAGNPVRAALTPNCSELFVVTDSPSVIAVSTTPFKVSRVLRLPHSVSALSSAPDGSRIYLAGDGLSAVATGTKEVSHLAELKGRDVLATPHGVYVAGGTAGLLRWEHHRQRIRLIHPAKSPVALTLTPDGRFLYVNYESGGPGGSFGHDAIARFDAASGAFIESITGLPNVGSWMTVSPDGAQLWASGLDACTSRLYDHAGCPLVPAGIVNVIDTGSRRLVASIGLAGRYEPASLDFLAGGRTVVLSGEGMRFVDARTFEVVGVEKRLRTRALALLPGRALGYAALVDVNKLALLEFK